MLGLLPLLLWSASTLATASTPALDQPPAVQVPDLSAALLVTIGGADGPDRVHAQGQDGNRLVVRLAGVAGVAGDDHARWMVGQGFLHDLLAGERAWLVAAGPSDAKANEKQWYVYRWPDKLFVNLEMVRQGAADVSPVVAGGRALGEVLGYWRDRARENRRGIWKISGTNPEVVVVDAAVSAGRAAIPAAQSVGTQPARMASAVAAPAGKTVVYVSAFGKKYHLASCRSLRSTKTPMLLEEARKSHEPCKQCNPPR